MWTPDVLGSSASTLWALVFLPHAQCRHYISLKAAGLTLSWARVCAQPPQHVWRHHQPRLTEGLLSLRGEVTRISTQLFGQTRICQTPQHTFFPLILTSQFKLFFGLDIRLSHRDLSRPGSLQMEPHVITREGHCLEAVRTGSSESSFRALWLPFLSHVALRKMASWCLSCHF